MSFWVLDQGAAGMEWIVAAHSDPGRKRNANEDFFAIDPTGTYLLAANQESDNIAVFRIDRASGGLTPVGQPFSVPRPVCVLMVKS